MSRHMKVATATAIVSSLLGALLGAGCKDEVGPAAPITVTAVSPATDLLGGGTGVTITGTNFVDVTSVTSGGNERGGRRVVSPTQITGTTPAATSPGATDVVVTSSSHGRGTCKGCFSYISLGLRQQLVAGGAHTCELTSTGAAYCWGANNYGQLGDGSTTNSATPVPVKGGLSFSAVATGGQHTCGLTSAGAAYCWGDNTKGQLGNASTTNSATPVAVAGGLSFGALAASGGHTCGLTSPGAAYCWGDNAEGQLGIGSTTNSSVPAVVAGELTFSALVTGRVHSCGFTSSGTAYCWGDNRFGQLGDGSTTNRATPVAVAGGLSFGALAAGGVSDPGVSYALRTCGLTNAGAAYCWGDNWNGQLGNGSTTNSAGPVAVA